MARMSHSTPQTRYGEMRGNPGCCSAGGFAQPLRSPGLRLMARDHDIAQHEQILNRLLQEIGRHYGELAESRD